MAEPDDPVIEVAVVNTTALFQNLAIVGALAERHLIDPATVAEWAEFFAIGMEKSARVAPANLEHLKVAARLRDYAR